MSRSKQPDNPAIALLWRSIGHVADWKRIALRRGDQSEYETLDETITTLLHAKARVWDEQESARLCRSREKARHSLLQRKAA